MKRKIDIAALSGWATLAVAVIASVLAVENRYALADELKAVEKDARISRYEMRMERAQDKLHGLLLIPVGARQQWQQKEILRLQDLIGKYANKIGEGNEDG